MEVICIETESFYALIEEVVNRILAKQRREDKWISGEEAMRMLRINSKSTLQKMRDEGKIRFSQPERKIILYDTESIHKFLNKHVREPF